MKAYIKEFEERKQKQKDLKKYKNYVLKALNERSDDIRLPEGTKVKLNYEWITGNPTYKKAQQAYKDFVENNKDNVFTVEYDKELPKKSFLVCLKEDATPIKWLWHSSLDLIAIETEE